VREPRTTAYVYLAVLSLLLSAGLAVKGARSAGVSADLTRRGVHTEGTVVAVTQQIEDVEPFGGVRQWTDVTVTFIDAQGSRVRATREGSDSAKVGEKLRIVYDPQDPAHVDWSTAVDEGPLDWAFAATSLLTCLALLAAAFRDVRRRKTKTGRNSVSSGSRG
jgi:hypothetical protein